MPAFLTTVEKVNPSVHQAYPSGCAISISSVLCRLILMAFQDGYLITLDIMVVDLGIL